MIHAVAQCQNSMLSQSEISFNRQTIVRVLSAITFSLLAASIAGQLAKHELGYDDAYGIIRLFNVDTEGNVPTFFSSFLLLLASLLLAVISALKRRSSDSRWRQWAVLSYVLLYMAVDEASGIHELLHRPADWLLGERLSRMLYFSWIIFGIAFVIGFALSYLNFFFSLPSKTRKQFLAAAATFLSGGMGMELVGGFYGGSHGLQNFQYSMLSTMEEGLEMAGVIVLISALLNYLIDHYDVRLRLDHLSESS
ncbi:MAG: multidrug transporter [Nitrospira sp.]